MKPYYLLNIKIILSLIQVKFNSNKSSFILNSAWLSLEIKKGSVSLLLKTENIHTVFSSVLRALKFSDFILQFLGLFVVLRAPFSLQNK